VRALQLSLDAIQQRLHLGLRLEEWVQRHLLFRRDQRLEKVVVRIRERIGNSSGVFQITAK
jgi:hypothetical protein